MACNIELSGKISLITGGCRGIGKEIAYKLAYAGATTLILDFERNDFFRDELKAISEKNDVFLGDVRDYQQLTEIKQRISDNYDSLDILVNNAGIVKVGPFEDITSKEISELFETNVYGVMNCCRVFGKLMIEQNSGRIINLTSTDASVGTTGHTSELGVNYVVAYASSKGAIVSLTKALAVEWGKYNINVNAVSPILVETPMTRHLFQNIEKLNEYKQGLPLQRNPRMEDIADAVVYLSSGLSKSVTGHILNVDCGYLAKSVRE